jgi:hypothetical protein
MKPASEFVFAVTIIMNRMSRLLDMDSAAP